MTTIPTYKQYVYGTEQERLTYERAHPDGTLYEHRRVYEPWEPEEADQQRRMAIQLIRGDEWHRSGACRSGRVWERMSCSTCALLGYEPREGWGDGYSVKRDGPNYGGWERAYVQAGQPIPAKWRIAFVQEGDNEAYYDALGRDIVTYGHPGFVKGGRR